MDEVDRVLEEYVAAHPEQRRTTMSAQRADAMTRTCLPVVQPATKVIGWWKVVLGAVVGLVAFGAAGGLYVSTFATHAELNSAIEMHSQLPGHAGMMKEMSDSRERLIRLETQVGQVIKNQDKMDEKLNQLLDVLRTISTYPLLPRSSAPSTP